MTASDTPTLDEVIAAYLDDLDRGSDVEAHEFVARWPEHRTEFLKFVERNLRFRNWTHENTSQLKPGPEYGSNTNFLDQRRIGPYRLERQIGRGGMSRVFQATRVDGGGQAALKMLDGGLTAEPTAEQRFRREAQAIQHVEHPHIVPLLDYGTDGGYSYLALQLIDGCTLADLIHWKKQDASWGAADSGDVTACDSKTLASTDRPDPSISPKFPRTPRSSDVFTKRQDTEQNQKVAAIWRALEISQPGCEYFAQISALVAQACGALQAAHDQGVVHRDIKPSNLMLDRSGHVWLTDFGLASMGEAHTVVTHTGQVIGTPNYMSPEQATGDSRQIDQRSDVYSMGATLYELATLNRPHDGERFRVLLEIAAGKLRAPSKLNPEIPRPLEAIILKAMSHRPEDRYASAADLAEDLLRFKAGDAVSARLPGTADRLMRWTVANPRKTIGIGTAVVLTGLLIMLTQFFHGQRLSLLNQRLASTNQQLNVSQQRLSRQVYVSDVAAAFRAYAQGDTDASRQFLSRHVPSLSGQNEVRDQRGFEWWLLDRLSSPTQPVLLGKHDEEATDVAVCPNGKELLTVGHDGCLRRWSIKNPGALRELNIGDNLDALAISPDGSQFVIGQNVVDGVNPVTLRDSQTGEVVSQLTGHNHAVESAAFSPDGAWIATAGRYHDVLLHSSDGKFQARFTSDSRNESLAFSADSKFLYVIKRNSEGDPIRQVLLKCSVPDLRIVQQLEVGISPLVCALSSDGRWLVTADNNGWVKLSSSGDTQPLRSEKLRGRVRCIAMNSNGSLLAAGCDNGLLYVWNFRDESQLPEPLVLDSGQVMVTGVKFVSDAAIATTSRDGSVRIWNLDDALSPYVEFSPEADFLKSGPEDPTSIHARSSAGNIEEIDLDTLTSKRLADVPPDYHHRFTKTSDNSLFFAGSDNGILAFELWPQREVYRIPYPKKSQACSWLELVDDDNRLLALYQDRLHCHRSSDGELLREFLIPEEGAERLAISPNEGYFIVLSRSILRCLELKSFRLLKQLPAQSSEYTCVRFSPDGEQIAVGYQDGTVKLLQANSLSLMHVLPGHREGVNDMRFLDQHTLATSSSDLRFWDIDSGRELGKLELEASIYHMHHSPSRQALYLTRRHQPMLMLSGQQGR